MHPCLLCASQFSLQSSQLASQLPVSGFSVCKSWRHPCVRREMPQTSATTHLELAPSPHSLSCSSFSSSASFSNTYKFLLSLLCLSLDKASKQANTASGDRFVFDKHLLTCIQLTLISGSCLHLRKLFSPDLSASIEALECCTGSRVESSTSDTTGATSTTISSSSSSSSPHRQLYHRQNCKTVSPPPSPPSPP